MHVALVAEDYYPQLGGVPEHVHHAAVELRASGHQVTVVTARMGGAGPDPDFVQRVGRSLVIYANGGLARITIGWNLTGQLEALFRRLRCDVVHVHGGLAPVLGILAPQAAVRAGIPVIATHHSWFPRSIGYRLFRRPLQALLDRHAASIAVSSTAIEAMSRYFQTDWEIIPNGVDVDAFHPGGRLPAAASGDSPELLFLGRLEPRTGLDTVLKAMPRIVARFPAVKLTVAGDGPWRAAYEKRAADLPVRFLGRVLDERPTLYRKADLYVCPTDRASFTQSLQVLMASPSASSSR
ncbi:MAG: glycosyltransferase family 4 protein [Gemmatimonadota bacterium]